MRTNLAGQPDNLKKFQDLDLKEIINQKFPEYLKRNASDPMVYTVYPMYSPNPAKSKVPPSPAELPPKPTPQILVYSRGV